MIGGKAKRSDFAIQVFNYGVKLWLKERSMLFHVREDACTVFNVETNKTTGIYDLEKLEGQDPYDVFLSGAAAVLYIENPNAATDRELVVFRDSFGSSLVPLLVQNYAKVTLVDTRYVVSDLVGQFVEFDDQDVLFMYSALVLNQSAVLR